MKNIVEFYRNLPKKRCQECNQVINEKADCYSNICDECDQPAR